MGRPVAAKAAGIVQRDRRRGEPKVLSEGRYKITARPDGALVIAWSPEAREGGVITLPPVIARLIDRAAAGEQISPAMVLRAMRG